MAPLEPPVAATEAPPDDGTDAPSGAEPGATSGAPGPWWHSPARLVVLALALVFLGGAVGYAWSTRASTPPGDGSVDVGFLQDMRLHHDQAVTMGFLALAKDARAQDPLVRQLAGEVVRGQQFEAGVMAQLLRSWGRPEANESGIVMGWMGMPLPADRMPGLATEADLDRLRAATGAEADRLFVDLMIAHHDGALHMAEEADARASDAEVRTLARAMREAQAYEIGELQRLRARLGA